MKKHNFSSGPAILPQSVFEQAAQACLELDGKGLSILEAVPKKYGHPYETRE